MAEELSTLSNTPTSTETPHPTTILLLTHARTASHVLERMLSKQPNAQYGSHYFVAARQQRRDLIARGPIDQTDPTLRADTMKTLNEGYQQFMEFLNEAKRQNKTAIVHTQPHAMISPVISSDYIYGQPTSSSSPPRSPEEVDFWLVGNDKNAAHTNPTVLPDQVFLRPGTVPIFNFRHPALVVDGVYRGMHNLPSYRIDLAMTRHGLALGGTLRWVRILYDWYEAQYRSSPGSCQAPIVLDADDYLGPDKHALMNKLCGLVPGLDAESVIYTWPRTSEAKMAAMPAQYREALQTILASEGVMTGYGWQGRSMEQEMRKWTEAYGREEAEFMKELVDKAMPDYEFLREKRLMP